MNFLHIMSLKGLNSSELTLHFVCDFFFLTRNSVENMGNLFSCPFCKQNVSLPQNDEDIPARQRNLNKARNKYKLEQKTFCFTESQKNQVDLVNVPPMVSN